MQQQLAWERQPDDRQWLKPEGDDPRTLYQMLMTSVERFAEHPCFGFIPEKGMPRVHMTYREFGELATSVGKQLRDVGVEAGDRVAMILNNSVEWAAISYGANAIGAAYTAMYTHQHGSEWAFILDDSTPSMIAVSDTEVLDKLVENMPADAAKWPKCGILLLGNEPANQLPPEGVQVHDWTSFVANGRASEAAIEIADDPFALNTLIYTSGTTGNPKGVMLTNWNTLSNILCVQSAFVIYVGDKNAAFLPWAHSFGSTFDLHWMIRCGVHINLISDLTKIADECIEIKPAVLLAVPRVWNKFYDRVNSQFDAATGLKKILIGRPRSMHQEESPRLASNVMLYLQEVSLTNCMINWFGPKFEHDLAATSDSVCLVQQHYRQMLQNLSNKLDSVATKDTDLLRLHHSLLLTVGLVLENPNCVVLAS